MSATIYDIAKASGVSIATVSRVFNNSDSVSEKTKTKILTTANAMGYHPKAFAQNLAKRNTNNIAVVVPVISNYFFIEVLAGIQDGISDFEFDLNIYNIKASNSTEDTFKQVEYVLKRGLADGYLLVSIHLTDQQWAQLKKYNVPVVLVDEFHHEFDSVSVDSIEGAYTATRFLIDQGYSCIAMISAADHSKPIKDRTLGYRRALEDSGRMVDDTYIVSSDDLNRDGFNEHGGYQAMLHILKNLPEVDAVFCSSDIQALGALKAMNDLKMHLPIISFDDIQIAKYLGLSTMRQPIYDLGKLAMDKMVERISTPDKMISHTVFSPELVVRTSSENGIPTITP